MNSGQPKVVVLGAQGALGRLCVPTLRRAGMNVVRAGRRAESASDFRLIDVSDATAVERGCVDADLVVSMVNDPSHTVERFVLEHGTAMLTAIVEPDSLSGARGVEDVFRLAEVRGGFEEQGIRIEEMA